MDQEAIIYDSYENSLKVPGANHENSEESILSAVKTIPQASLATGQHEGSLMSAALSDNLSSYHTLAGVKENLSNLPLPGFEKYLAVEAIGSGSFSIVYKVKRKKDGKIFAAKVIDLNRSDEFSVKERKNILNEVRLLASINHPNIIRHIETFTVKDNNKD